MSDYRQDKLDLFVKTNLKTAFFHNSKKFIHLYPVNLEMIFSLNR